VGLGGCGLYPGFSAVLCFSLCNAVLAGGKEGRRKKKKGAERRKGRKSRGINGISISCNFPRGGGEKGRKKGGKKQSRKRRGVEYVCFPLDPESTAKGKKGGGGGGGRNRKGRGKRCGVQPPVRPPITINPIDLLAGGEGGGGERKKGLEKGKKGNGMARRRKKEGEEDWEKGKGIVCRPISPFLFHAVGEGGEKKGGKRGG